MSLGTDLLITRESQATQLRTLDLMWLSTHLPTVQPTSHIFSFPLAKAFPVENVKSIWSVKTVLGILPEAVLYFMRSA